MHFSYLQFEMCKKKPTICAFHEKFNKHNNNYMCVCDTVAFISLSLEMAHKSVCITCLASQKRGETKNLGFKLLEVWHAKRYPCKYYKCTRAPFEKPLDTRTTS